MELCTFGHQMTTSHLFEKDLLENLKTMHSIGIVHRDIKPPNIAWSNNFKKWVLLDFGFTRFLKEEIGEKTKTFFHGTYSYSSPAMKKAFILQK